MELIREFLKYVAFFASFVIVIALFCATIIRTIDEERDHDKQ